MNGLQWIMGFGCGVLLATTSAAAEPEDAADRGFQMRLEVDTIISAQPGLVGAERSTAGVADITWSQRNPAARGALAFASEQGLRARWWWGRGGLEVGAGADWASPSMLASGARASTAVVALRATLSPSTKIVYETDTAQLVRAADDPSAAQLRGPRVTLEFKPVSGTHDLRLGLVRMQLSASSSLNLRPRSGGLQLSYRARF